MTRLATLVMSDAFSEPIASGKVVGSRSRDGVRRGGIDRERVISADNGSLRIAPLIEPGWGRAGLAYGPYERQPGLTFAAFLLNGHNTAQSGNIAETFRGRLHRWLIGSGTARYRERLLQCVRHGRKRRLARAFRWWWRLRKTAPSVPSVTENLAVGWFSEESPAAPAAAGNAFLVHAGNAINGELWPRVASRSMPAITGVQNLPIYYVVVLRACGAAYYVASVPGANGMAAYPFMRPVAVDVSDATGALYPGIHQSVLGEIGFRLDTRVYGARVAHLPAFESWYGSAHAADRLIGGVALAGTDAEIGGAWWVTHGTAQRWSAGDAAHPQPVMALLRPSAPSGLIHAVFHDARGAGGSASLVWRAAGPDSYWSVDVGSLGATISMTEGGRRTVMARAATASLAFERPRSVQVLDDGRTLGVFLDGAPLFDTGVCDARLSAECGVGFAISDARMVVSDFEAHPRDVPLPRSLDMGEPWSPDSGPVLVADDFDGPVRDLSDRVVPIGGKTWRKELGPGKLLAGGGRASVDAALGRPNPGRTAYTVEWDDPSFAEIEVEITPPGTARGERHEGRAGLILWSDAENYIILNIWLTDSYPGASLSTFFHLNGFEDIYDAIWTNVGKRIQFGVPVRVRLSFDTGQYLAFLDEEPVLYRALTDVYPDTGPFIVRRVGIAANWEWGNDTGSTLRSFRGRGRSSGKKVCL